jgi:hypothetical protein
MSGLSRALRMTRAGRFVAAVTMLSVAAGILAVLFGVALAIEMRNAAPALAVVAPPADHPPLPADPPVTQTTVVTQTSVTTVTTTSPTTVTSTTTTTVPTTVYTTVTTSVPGPATSTAYVCGAGYHVEGGQCVGNGPIVR